MFYSNPNQKRWDLIREAKKRIQQVLDEISQYVDGSTSRSVDDAQIKDFLNMGKMAEQMALRYMKSQLRQEKTLIEERRSRRRGRLTQTDRKMIEGIIVNHLENLDAFEDINQVPRLSDKKLIEELLNLDWEAYADDEDVGPVNEILDSFGA
jgi:hypothetical protein